MSDPFARPAHLVCEATKRAGTEQSYGGGRQCGRPATYIYGPECEAETGRLMYLCDEHAQYIKEWRMAHLYEPVECPTHGRLGPVKNYLILREM